MQTKPVRDTRQRSAIKQVITEAGRPLGPKEILKLAQPYVPNLGIATVYRNLKMMLEHGELESVDLPGQAPRYQEPTTGNRRLFVDEKTDEVYCFECSDSDSEPKLPDGFRVKRMEVIYYGETVS